jgi:hypothetical protein
MNEAAGAGRASGPEKVEPEKVARVQQAEAEPAEETFVGPDRFDKEGALIAYSEELAAKPPDRVQTTEAEGGGV